MRSTTLLLDDDDETEPLLDLSGLEKAPEKQLIPAEQLRAEIIKLDEWLRLNEQQFHIAYENVRRIRKKLRSALDYGYYLRHHTQDAMAVNQALAVQDDATLATLKERADIAIGASSPQRKAIGAGLMLLGISLLVLALLVMSAVLACSFPLAGFFLLLAGNASFCIGFSFFRAGLQRGMARELDGLERKLQLTLCLR